MAAETLRWMKFWPQDWESDEKLRMCSLGARGLWISLMCLMHKAEPYGHLLINGKKPDAKRIATLIGVSDRQVCAALTELEHEGVYSKTESGVIFSRRMVRDKEASEKGRTYGRQGGNPTLVGDGLTPPNKDTLPNRGEGGGVKLEAEKEAEREAEAERTPTPPSGARAPAPRKRSAESIGTRLTEEWNPGADGAAFARSMGLEPTPVFEVFRDFWLAKAGKDARKVDWPRTWKNWCRKEASSRVRVQKTKPSRVDALSGLELPLGPPIDLPGEAQYHGTTIDGTAEETKP